jgi:hypothetical protein
VLRHRAHRREILSFLRCRWGAWSCEWAVAPGRRVAVGIAFFERVALMAGAGVWAVRNFRPAAVKA